MKCVFLAYLDQKVSTKVKIYSFLTFMLINFLDSADATTYRNSNFEFFGS